MKNKSIGVFRGAFDPVTEGHMGAIVSSFKYLTLSKLYVIVKFIGEKDLAGSSEQRIEMMKLQVKDCSLPVEVVRQNIKGHVEELIELKDKYNCPIINICDSDKAPTEMEVYGNSGDTFGMTLRTGNLVNEAYEVAKRKNIKIVEINQDYYTSSTYVRSNILKNIIEQPCLNPEVSKYILNNNLYTPVDNNFRREKFLSGWYRFLDKLNSIYPELKLLEISDPIFKSTQSEAGWNEKYIRTILYVHRFKNNDLLEFVTKAEKCLLLCDLFK